MFKEQIIDIIYNKNIAASDRLHNIEPIEINFKDSKIV